MSKDRATKEQKTPLPEPLRGETLPAVRSTWQMSTDDPPAKWPTNLDTQSQGGMARLLNSANPPSLALDGHGELRMRLCAYVVCLVEKLHEEKGEYYQTPRTALFDVSGKHFVTTSEFAPAKMRNFQVVFTPDQWREGLPIIIREQPSRRPGRKTHVIDLDLSQMV